MANEFARRQYLVSIAHARKTLREMLDAADGVDDAKLTTTKGDTRELLRQGRLLEDALPSGPDSADPVIAIRRDYVTSIYHVRRIARELLEAHDARDIARIAAAKAAARELLGARLQKP